MSFRVDVIAAINKRKDEIFTKMFELQARRRFRVKKSATPSASTSDDAPESQVRGVKATFPLGQWSALRARAYSAHRITMTESTPLYVAVVDDDENLCRSLGRLLSATGIRPVTYTSAEAFLADMKRPQFNCLVLDIQLGGISGIELAHLLLAQGERIPFIYLTAHDDPEMRASAEVVGCAGYFRKTDSGEELLEAIRRAAT